MLTCYNDSYSVTPCVWIRCKLALVNCLFSFSDVFYHQGGHFTSNDIKAFSVIISVKDNRCRSNIIEAAIIQSYRKCCKYQWTRWQSETPPQRHLDTSFCHWHINCSNVIWIRLIPSWRRCSPLNWSRWKKFIAEKFILSTRFWKLHFNNCAHKWHAQSVIILLDNSRD